MITRTTRVRNPVMVVEGVSLPASYRAGQFRPIALFEELIESEGYTSYTATFSGPMIKKDGGDGKNRGERRYTLATRDGAVTHDDLDRIPMSLRSALRGEQSLRDQRFT